jgi:hypothetical protein
MNKIPFTCPFAIVKEQGSSKLGIIFPILAYTPSAAMRLFKFDRSDIDDRLKTEHNHIPWRAD